ncbi:MAG TPA: DUF4175 family protein [Tepidisphaeraceae bacterium]|jgi:hypothetical protein|nr:DUF4175 family protein [Tepidisphaeraceae bacterium]
MPPTALINSLDSIRKRVRLLSVVFGVGLVAASAVALIFLLILLDYTLNLPPVPRVFMLLIALIALGYAMYRWIVSPLLAKLSLTDVASRLEAAFPQFDDRLRSTVDFLGGRVPGSEMMQSRVVDETTRLAGTLNLGSAIVTKPVWYSASAGLGAILLFFGLAAFVVTPQFRSIAFSRLFSPFAGVAWPKSVQIDMLGDIPDRIPVGQHLDLKMKLAKGDRASAKAIVLYQYGEIRNGEFVGGPIQQEYMSRATDGAFASSLDTRVDSNSPASTMRVWIKSGDDEAHLRDITIVPRLTIKAVTATVTPPAYVSSDAKPQVFDLTKGGAIMPIGANLKLDVTFNKPLTGKPQDVIIEPADATMSAPKFASSISIPGGVSDTWQARQSLRFHIRATDTDNFRNSALEEYELIVRPDQNPSVQIENPRRNEERTAVSTVPLQGLAEDDYGIQSLKLVVDRLGDKKHWDVSLVAGSNPATRVTWTPRENSGDRLRFSMNYIWDLAQLKDASLAPGDVLEYYLLVQDNFNLDNQTHPPVPSGHLRIAIVSQEDLTSKVIEDLRQVKNVVGEIKTTQDRTRSQTQSLTEDTKDKPQLDAADRQAADRLANQQATAATQAKQLAGKLDEIQNRLEENKSTAQELKDLARDVKNDLNQSAETNMKDAAAQLGQANQPNTPQPQRNDQLNKAQQNQQQASNRLQQALDRMENIGTLAQTIDRISELLRQQKDVSKQTADVGKQNIGKKPDEMSPQDRGKLNKAADAQAKLAEKSQQAMASMAKTADQLEKADPSAAKAMKDAAQTGQQQQVQQNQQKASSQARENQQAQAQAAQKQAELGLQMMLNQLNEAQKRKLAELSKQLAELKEQVENLIRRQAGHNLDDLTLQGADHLAKLDAKTRSELFEIAERDEKVTNNTDLPTLSTAQELTERNARDIGKTADAVPNAGEAASQIIRAADKMERAIVYLRQSKLAEAYEPPQVDALASLLDAQKKVETMKQDVDRQANQQHKEEIRQQYIKIKEDQEKLNADTTKIETAHQPDGTLPRLSAIRLGQLPGEQGKLADRVTELAKDLTDADSIIYLWANNDLATSMSGVKDYLGKQQTGVTTQTEQNRIVVQLQAMIDNLVEPKPDQSKFAQDSNGGGGGGGAGAQGGGKKRLPTEAELKLTQALQKAVNSATKVLSDQKDKDKPELLSLGNRQGQLRDILGQLLEKSSQGQIHFGPEPDNRDQLPEEANKEQVENQELDQQLLTGEQADEKTDKQVNLVGDRMARVRQRLALNDDPGKTTQIIEDRIITDLDILVDQARQQQAQTRNAKPKPGQQQQQQPKPGDQQAQNQGKQQQQSHGNTPAAKSTLNPGKDGQADLSQQIRESMQEWGGVTPRQRAAVIEGGGETIIEPYKKLIDDYYKSLATKTTDR